MKVVDKKNIKMFYGLLKKKLFCLTFISIYHISNILQINIESYLLSQAKPHQGLFIPSVSLVTNPFLSVPYLIFLDLSIIIIIILHFSGIKLYKNRIYIFHLLWWHALIHKCKGTIVKSAVV